MNDIKVIKDCRHKFLYVVVFSFFTNLLLFTAPLFSLQVFDRILSTRSLDTLYFLFVISLIALTALFILDIVRNLAMIHIAAVLEKGLSSTLYKAPFIKIDKAQKLDAGLNDLTKCRNFISSSSVISLIDAPCAPLFILIIYFLHPLLGTCALFGALSLFIIALLNNKLMTSNLIEANDHQKNASLQARQVMEHSLAVQSMGMLGNTLTKWQSHNNLSSGSFTKAFTYNSILNSVAKFIRLILQMVLIATGAYLVIQSELTPGGMLAATIIMGRALSPVEQSINSWRQFTEARSSWTNIKLTLDKINLSENDKLQLPKPEGNVKVEKLSFAYQKGKPALNGVNFKINTGESIGIIGPSGSGKSTLLKLLSGAMYPLQGNVRLDGLPLQDWSSQCREKFIGYVPQNFELFDGSIKENIARLGKVDNKAVIDAAKLTGAHEWILKLPEAYETEIGLNASKLSGGQKQSLAITRALYNNPTLLVMDEPNANLDSKNEISLLKTFKKLREKGTTLLVSSHKPSMLQNFDRILVIQDGKISAFDQSSEILNKFRSGTTKEVKHAL